jgi:hypothetical protein
MVGFLREKKGFGGVRQKFVSYDDYPISMLIIDPTFNQPIQFKGATYITE